MQLALLTSLNKFFNFIFYLPLNSWEWFRPSLEGGDNKASIRRIGAIALLVQGLAWTVTLCYRLLLHPTAQIPMATVWILIVLLTASLLLFGIITAQQLVEVLKGRTFAVSETPTETPAENENPLG
jgi:hypothetical protein